LFAVWSWRQRGPWAGRRILAGIIGCLTIGLGLVGCAPVESRRASVGLPTPGPPPAGASAQVNPPPGIQAVTVRRGPTPTPVQGSRPPPSSKVKMKREFWLLEGPRVDAQRLPIGLVGQDRTWDVKEETDGWVRIDAGPFTGWAPRDAVEFVG
jgi:hypothetical protein